MNIYTESLGFGIVTAAIISISAVAFTLQFAITNILNLALAATMSVAGLIAYSANKAGLSIWLSLVVAGVVGAIVSLLIDLVIFEPFLRRGSSLAAMLVVTFAVGVIVLNFVEGLVGPGVFSFRWNEGRSWHIAGMILTTTQLITIGVALVIMGSVQLGLRYTRFGKALRATAADPSLARACGIRVSRLSHSVWLLSGALLGVGAVLLFMDTAAFDVNTASDFVIVVIAAAVVGGIGQASGAMLGALIVGVSTEFAATLFNPALKEVVALGLLIAVLLIRPRGILSEVAASRSVG